MRLETKLIALHSPTLSPGEIELKLRTSETPVISRIENEDVLIDLRTVAFSDEGELMETVAAVLG